MAYRLVLDENVEHDVYHRLTNYGHDVTHVDFVSTLGKGVDDRSIADYSRETNRVIVTYDDDFALELTDEGYRRGPAGGRQRRNRRRARRSVQRDAS
jgi:predicted nuclease of predicted toxin-antitoxin system